MIYKWKTGPVLEIIQHKRNYGKGLVSLSVCGKERPGVASLYSCKWSSVDCPDCLEFRPEIPVPKEDIIA